MATLAERGRSVSWDVASRATPSLVDRLRVASECSQLGQGDSTLVREPKWCPVVPERIGVVSLVVAGSDRQPLIRDQTTTCAHLALSTREEEQKDVE